MDEDIKPKQNPAVQVDKQPVAGFNAVVRSELLNLYAGWAMQGRLSTGGFVYLSAEGANDCVADANRLLEALERYHTAALANMGSGDPEAVGNGDVQH